MTSDVESPRAAWQEERTSAFLYRVMEEVERGTRAHLFARLRGAAERQAELWERQIRAAGGTIPAFRLPMRARVAAWLLRRLGPQRVLPVLAALKVRGLSVYRDGRTEDRSPGESPVPDPRPAESWHRARQGGGALRAAVFGVNDGLVSNAGLIVGVAGAGAEPRTIVIAGLSGFLAGSLSMATGEYISVKTQRELLEYQIALERHELEVMPEEEIDELAMIYEAKGLDPPAARSLATRLIADPQRGLDTLVREELGLNPRDLVSPLSAAGASFASFAAGALIPLIPFLLPSSPAPLLGTVVAMELGLLVVGGLMSLFTGRSVIWSAVRMALLGSAAALATFSIGGWLGAAGR